MTGNGATLKVHGGIFVREKTPSGADCKLTIVYVLAHNGVSKKVTITVR